MFDSTTTRECRAIDSHKHIAVARRHNSNDVDQERHPSCLECVITTNHTDHTSINQSRVVC